MPETVMVAIVGLVAAVIGSALTIYSQRRKVKAEANKNEAEANEQIRQTVMSLIKPLKDTITDLEQKRELDKKEMDALKSTMEKWKSWAFRMVDQLKGMGCEPVPFEVTKSKGE